MRQPNYFNEKVRCVCCGTKTIRFDTVKTKEGRFCSVCYESSLSKFFKRLFKHLNCKEIAAAQARYAHFAKQTDTTGELPAILL
jgi:hypothetical protein